MCPQLFSLNKGDEYLPSTLPTRGGTVFWSVTRRIADHTIIIKVVSGSHNERSNIVNGVSQVSNIASTTAALSFQLPFKNVAAAGTLELLHGAPTASNTPQQPNLVVPVTSSITTGKTINYSAPGFSVSVIKVQAS